MVALGDFRTGGGHPFGALAHIRDHTGQALGHRAQGMQQLPKFVGAPGGDHGTQVATGNAVCRLISLLQWFSDGAHQPSCACEDDHHNNRQRHQDAEIIGLAACLYVRLNFLDTLALQGRQFLLAAGKSRRGGQVLGIHELKGFLGPAFDFELTHFFSRSQSRLAQVRNFLQLRPVGVRQRHRLHFFLQF